jgi:hypothetical protein
METHRYQGEFAALINAKPSEIAYVANTSTGENRPIRLFEAAGSSAPVAPGRQNLSTH